MPRKHTCYLDDGGTPRRRCYGCEEEGRRAREAAAPLRQEVARFDKGELREGDGGSDTSRALLREQGFVNWWDWEGEV